MSFLPRHIIPTLFLLATCACNCFAQRISQTDTTTEHTIRATFYHDRFEGRKTSSGEVFRQELFTAAHKYLKFGTLLLVTNPQNGKQVIVRINDRCPKDKILDITRRSAKLIDIKSAKVTIRLLPERYSEIWERQNQLLEILAKGEIMEYAANYFSGNVKRTQTTPSDTSPTPTVKDDGNHLYDIELQRSSNTKTEKIINKLPLYLQDKVGMRTIQGSKEQSVVLFLALPHKEATKILSSLQPKFPDAALIPSN